MFKTVTAQDHVTGLAQSHTVSALNHIRKPSGELNNQVEWLIYQKYNWYYSTKLKDFNHM